MSQLQDPYRLLDIPLDASPAHLKQAYKDLVFVWHPDRFSGNPRLQKKAEEKLKCINLAYQQIRAKHQSQDPSPQSTSTQHPPQGPQTRQTQTHHKQSRQKHHQQRSGHKTHHDQCVGISLKQVKFIVSHFKFRALKRGTPTHRHFKSGPFELEISTAPEWIKLENLCDSLNGFHPILLAIPCKASATFFGCEGKEVIELFKRSQTHSSGL